MQPEYLLSLLLLSFFSLNSLNLPKTDYLQFGAEVLYLTLDEMDAPEIKSKWSMNGT